MVPGSLSRSFTQRVRLGGSSRRTVGFVLETHPPRVNPSTAIHTHRRVCHIRASASWPQSLCRQRVACVWTGRGVVCDNQSNRPYGSASDPVRRRHLGPPPRPLALGGGDPAAPAAR